MVPPGVREHEGEDVSDTRVEKSRWHSDESRTLKGHQRQAIRAATHTTRSSLFGAMCALATFGRLTMVEACTHNESNLGKVCDEKGYSYERLGLFNDYDLSKPQGYHKAKFLLDEQRPEIFVSSPPRGPWSIMQNVNQRDERQRENLRKKRLKSHRIFKNGKRLI